MESEETLSDSERMSILSQVLAPKKKIAESKKVVVVRPGSSPSSDLGEGPKDTQETSPSMGPSVPSNGEQLESFGSLLEKTLQRRQVMDKEENDVVSEDRKMAIDESRKDLIGDMVKVFFR